SAPGVVVRILVTSRTMSCPRINWKVASVLLTLCSSAQWWNVAWSVAAQSTHEHRGSPTLRFPRELTERSITIRDGIGKTHDRVRTNSREAQAFYDQG